MNSKYLAGIYHKQFEMIDGFYVAHHYRNPNHSRFISSYNNGKYQKRRLFNCMRMFGQDEIEKDWELHHIVEGQHFADIDFSGRLKKMYAEELPCVFIHKIEHRAYNSLLHVKETGELYRDELPKDMLQRSHQAVVSAADKSKKRELLTRIRKLENLYLDAYSGDPIFQRIAQNVFSEAKQVVL